MSVASATPISGHLPLGTSAPYPRMHRNVRRVCFVLLFGLVIEGALTFPLLAIWYGFPKVSATHVCADLRKVMYSDPKEQCDSPNQFPGSPISGPSEFGKPIQREGRLGGTTSAALLQDQFPGVRERSRLSRQFEQFRRVGQR